MAALRSKSETLWPNITSLREFSGDIEVTDADHKEGNEKLSTDSDTATAIALARSLAAKLTELGKQRAAAE